MEMLDFLVGQVWNVTVPFGGPVISKQVNDQEVEGGKGASAWLQFGAIRRS
jgi:hypothetical protein